MSGKRFRKVFFIAEIASSHNGSKKNLQKIVNELIKTDVSAIKLQIFNYKKLVHKSYKYYKTLKRISLPNSFLEKIIQIILKANKEVILEPFDDDSFNFCRKFNKKISIKVSSSDNNNKKFIKSALSVFKKVFISISGMNLVDVKKILKENSKNKKIILTYGFQSFPTKIEDLRLNFIYNLKKIRNKICYADHTSANSLIDNILTIQQAIKNGSMFIEKHVTLDKNKGYPDSDSSLEISEFNDLVNFFNKKISNKNTISKNERKYSKNMTRNAVLKKKVIKDKVFNINDVLFLRTGEEGIPFNEIKRFKNKVYNNNYKDNDILKKKFFYKK
jgi:N-acetylneuraminate synthase